MYTEIQAWVYLAECWDRARPARRNSPHVQALVGLGKVWGLCSSLNRLMATQEISESTLKSMEAKLATHPEFSTTVLIWKSNRRGAKSRAKFCRAQVSKIAKENS